MKKLLKYQLIDMRNVVLMFFGVYILLEIIAITVVATTENNEITVNGFESSSIIVCFILGIVIFKEYYWMAAQNSISRKTFFKTCIISLLITSISIAILGLLSQFVGRITSLFHARFLYTNISQILYNMPNTFAGNIINIIFSVSFFTSAALIGYLIALLFYRANKICKILIAAGIPITVFLVLPMMFTHFIRLGKKAENIFLLLSGIESGSPIVGILSLLLISLITGTICYCLVKKVEIS